MKITTLTLGLFFFTKEEHPQKLTHDEQLQFSLKYIHEFKTKRYEKELGGRKKWNWYSDSRLLPSKEFRLSGLDFRHPHTNEIADQRRYLDFCREIKPSWREGLLAKKPKYKAKVLDAALDRAQFIYSPEDNLLAFSVLLPDYVRSGKEDLR